MKQETVQSFLHMAFEQQQKYIMWKLILSAKQRNFTSDAIY
jgi:hypothetical protein